jgi:trk system potassium uptake protein TrkA
MIWNEPTAERLGETEPVTHHVLGEQHLATALARRLRAAGHGVGLIADTEEPPGIPVTRGDPSDIEVLEAAGVTAASTVVVATRSDRRNLLIAQLVTTRFDPERVLVLANAPSRLEPFAAAGHEPVCATTALSAALSENLGEQR